MSEGIKEYLWEHTISGTFGGSFADNKERELRGEILAAIRTAGIKKGKSADETRNRKSTWIIGFAERFLYYRRKKSMSGLSPSICRIIMIPQL